MLQAQTVAAGTHIASGAIVPRPRQVAGRVQRCLVLLPASLSSHTLSQMCLRAFMAPAGSVLVWSTRRVPLTTPAPLTERYGRNSVMCGDGETAVHKIHTINQPALTQAKMLTHRRA